jgi:signal transduction histidine kinase/CheY-like chemotaxis protein
MFVSREGVGERFGRVARLACWALLSGAAYVVLSLAGAATAIRPSNVATVWPASGLLVGLLAIRRHEDWPALLVGGFAGSFFASLVSHTTLAPSILVALANMIEAFLAVWLPERVRGSRLQIHSVVDMLWFFLLPVLGVPALGAALGGGASAWLAGQPSWNVLHLWWMSNGLGILLVTPFILAMAEQRHRAASWSRARIIEAFALLGVLVLGLVLIYSWIDASPIVLFPIVLWAALRFGVGGVASLMLSLSAIAFTETARGHAMGSLFGGFAPYDLLDVQAFLSVTALSALGLAAALAERRRVEEALIEAQVRKDAFLAMLSHELRNPLTPIRNCLFILDHLLPQADQSRRALATIDRQVTYLTRLVGDLLDVTRISRGKIELRRQILDLREIVDRTVEDYRSLFTSHNLGLRVEQERVPVWINGDVTRLAQAVGNILNNAFKFTPEGGLVTVALRKEGDSVWLSVRDNGVGLAPETMRHLFEPFAQAEQSLDRRAGGLGLGLALAQGLIGLHGGKIEAHSAGLGQGSEFVIRLPAVAEPVSDANHAGGNGAAAHATAELRVLIIEDSTDAAQTLKEALELNNHQVKVAGNGPEGLSLAHKFRPDIVFCDIGLPDMNGYDVARAFRSDEFLQGTVLVALTGYASPEDSRKAREAGFDRHVAKPPDLRILESIISDLPIYRSAYRGLGMNPPGSARHQNTRTSSQ